MKKITNINTIDKNGEGHSFIVQEEDFQLKEFKGTKYEITLEELPRYKYFEFKTLNISNDRILVYLIVNHDHEKLSNKGIVKAMIKKISETFQKDVVSSTNKEELKIDETEGRISLVDCYWKKWCKKMDNVSYSEEEDRYIYRFKEDYGKNSN